MNRIFKLEPYRKSRVKVYLQEEKPAFALYAKEVKQYELKEGEELTEELYERILSEVLIKRAQCRALYLLADYARTEYQLRKKLAEGFYPPEAVDSAVEYVKKYHYLDDAYYAENFAENRTRKKSRRMVELELRKRGIDRETAREAVQKLEIPEKDTIRSLILKKFPEPEKAETGEILKLLRSLTSKGFPYDDCREVMGELGMRLRDDAGGI